MGKLFKWYDKPEGGNIIYTGDKYQIANISEDLVFYFAGVGDCGKGRVTVKVKVNKIIANAGPDANICMGETIQLNASGGTNYQWTPTNGLRDPNTPNPEIY